MSDAEANALWDDVQCEILVALGHAPLVLAPRELPADPLLHAVLRAANRGAHSHDLDDLLRALPAMAALRGSTSAKRTLWPQLRRFRGRLQ